MKKITLLFCTFVSLLLNTLPTKAQWQMTTASLTSSVYCLSAKGTTLFAGTISNGLYKSTNNGGTWTAANTGLTFPSIYSLAISGNNIFAGTFGGGVFVSADNGSHWTEANNGLTGRYVFSLAVQGSYIYAAGDLGVFRSTDNGNSWAAVSNGLPASSYMISLTTCGTRLFAGSYYGGIYLSVDSGNSWTASGLSSNELYSFATDGRATIFAGSHANGVFLSSDTGKSWTPVDSDLINKGVYSLAFSGSTILTGTDGGGVFLSHNNGSLWVGFDSTGLTSTHIYSLLISDDTIFAGTNNGQVWKRALSDITICAPVITSSGLNTFCQGGSVTLTATADIGYNWSTGDTTQSIVVTSSGNYSCIVTTPCGNLTTNLITVTVKPVPVVTISPGGPTTFCKGGNVQLTASGSNSYLWSNSATTSSITVATSQIVTVTGFGSNGCHANSSISISSIPPPTIISQPKPQNVFADCIAGFSVSVADTTGLDYQWQANVGFGFSNLSNAGVYSGANTNALFIGDASLAMNGYTYRCALSNSGCNDTSASALLTVKPASKSVRSDTLCAGDSIIVGIHTYNISGTYNDTLSSFAGCDSIIITTHLLLDSTIRSSQSVTLCAGDSFTVGIHTYISSGIYIDSLSAGKGCDSIVTTTLVLASVIKSSQTITLCNGANLIVGSHIYSDTTKSGTYIDSLQNGHGCDSIVTTHLTVRPLIATIQKDTLCAGYSITVGTHTYTLTGTYTDTLTSVTGCDSTITTHLVIDSIIRSSQSVMICEGDSVTVGIHTYMASGTYMDSLATGIGCDSIVTTYLTHINDITVRNDTIMASATEATYQWINCANLDSILAVTQSYFPAADGDYAVIVTANGCSDTSVCVTISNVGIEVTALNYATTIYPNPATNQLTIHTSSPVDFKELTISVMNVVGEITLEEKVKWSRDVIININDLPAGMYFLQMKSETGSIVKRFVKD